MRLLTGYTKPVIALALAPDGARLFSAADGQTMIWEWDLAQALLARKLRCGFARRGIHALAMSPRGDFFVSAAAGGGLGYWPLAGGEPRQLDRDRGEEDHLSYYPGLAVHPQRRLVAASFYRAGRRRNRYEYGFQTWDLADSDRNAVRAGHTSYVSSVAFSADGGLVATASQDGTVRLWPLGGGEPRVLDVRVRPVKVAFRPDGQRVAAAGGRSVFLFNVEGKLLAELKGHGGTVNALAYSPDGQLLASVGADGAVILRDLNNEVVGQRHLEVGKLESLAWRADSSGLVVGGDKVIAVCERDELLVRQQKRPRGEPLSLAGPGSKKIKGLSYSPDGRLLACWDKHSAWRLWDLSGGPTQAKVPPKPCPSFGHADGVSWSPDSTRLAVTDSSHHFGFGMQELGDVRSGKSNLVSVRNLEVSHLAFTPDGRRFLAINPHKSAGQRWTRLELREADSKRVLFSKKVHMPNTQARVTHSAFSPGGRRVYAAFRGQGLHRWTPAEDEFVHLFAQGSLVTGLAVSADERLVLTTGGNAALLWSLPEGKKLAEFKHPLACSGAALLPGGRVITACYDGQVRVWDAGGGGELFALDLGMGTVYALAVAPDHMTFAAGVHRRGASRIVLMDVPE